MDKKEYVNHPSHYNQHPQGIECIDIIRHYTCDIANAIKYLWRAGLKKEMGKFDAEKEIEDLKKALWYIEDYKKNVPKTENFTTTCVSELFQETTGYSIEEVVAPYDGTIAEALNCLFSMSILRNGIIWVVCTHQYFLDLATKDIEKRIREISASDARQA